MKVRLLAVEDSPEFKDELRETFGRLSQELEVTYAEGKLSAIDALDRCFFDIVTLDLKIPVVDEELDREVAHGMAVLSHIKQNYPGTCVVILTGSPAEERFDEMLTATRTIDIWASGHEFQTIRFVKKDRLSQLDEILPPMIEAILSLRDIEVRESIGVDQLSEADNRLIRIFVKQRMGVSYRLRRIGGGLSDADVYRLTIADEAGVITFNAILKIGDKKMVASEEGNYNLHVNRLDPAATPRFLAALNYGGGARAAVGFSLADGFSRDAFAIAKNDQSHSEDLLDRLSNYLFPWRRGVPEQRRSIREVRQRTLNDIKFERICSEYQLDWADGIEARPVQVNWCIRHGDLHGGNVLVSEANVPTIIDYGDIGEGPAAFDWVTLELSTIFHKDGPARGTDWPSQADCEQWQDIDDFAANCPFPGFLRGCRQHALAAATGPREVAVCAYGYLLRQLGYPDTDKPTALSLLQAVRTSLDS